MLAYCSALAKKLFFTYVLSVKRAAKKIVAKLPTLKRKQRHIAQQLLSIVKDDLVLLKELITTDESWVFGYDRKIKAQFKRPQEPRLKNTRHVRPNE